MSSMSDFLVKVQNPDFAQSNALMKSGLTAITEAADPFKDAMNQHYKDNAKRVTDAALNYIKTNDMNNPDNQAGLQKLMDASGFLNAGGNLGELGTAITNNKEKYLETQRNYNALTDVGTIEQIQNKYLQRMSLAKTPEEQAQVRVDLENDLATAKFGTSMQGASIAATAPVREAAMRQSQVLGQLFTGMTANRGLFGPAVESAIGYDAKVAAAVGGAQGAFGAIKNAASGVIPENKFTFPNSTYESGAGTLNSSYVSHTGKPLDNNTVGLMKQFDPVFKAAGKQVGLPDYLIKSIAMAESGFNPNAKSPVGAQGMMQVMPFNSGGPRAIYKHDPFNPNQNILAGASIYRDNLNSLKKKYGNKFTEEDYWALALGAYNAGEGRVDQAIKAASKNNKSIDASIVAKYLPAETRDYIPRIQHYIKQFGPKPKSWADDPAVLKMFNNKVGNSNNILNANQVKQFGFKTAIKDNALKGNVREDTVNFAKVLDDNGLNGNMARFSAFNDSYKGHAPGKASHGSGHKFDLVLKDGSVQSYQQARQQVIELANQSGYDVVVSAEHPDGTKQGLEGFNWYPGKSTGAHLDIKVVGRKDGSYNSGSFNSKGNFTMSNELGDIKSPLQLETEAKLLRAAGDMSESKYRGLADAERSVLGLVSSNPMDMIMSATSLGNGLGLKGIADSLINPTSLLDTYNNQKQVINDYETSRDAISKNAIQQAVSNIKSNTSELYNTAKVIKDEQAKAAEEQSKVNTLSNVLGGKEREEEFKAWLKDRGYAPEVFEAASLDLQTKLIDDFGEATYKTVIASRLDKAEELTKGIDIPTITGAIRIKYSSKDDEPEKAENMAKNFETVFMPIFKAQHNNKVPDKEYSNEELAKIYYDAYDIYLGMLATADKSKKSGIIFSTDYGKALEKGMITKNGNLFESAVNQSIKRNRLNRAVDKNKTLINATK